MSEQHESLNPNNISKKERDFLENKPEKKRLMREKYQTVTLSFPQSFDNKLIDFLNKYPTQGKKSSFIARIVDNYINKFEKDNNNDF